MNFQVSYFRIFLTVIFPAILLISPAALTQSTAIFDAEGTGYAPGQAPPQSFHYIPKKPGHYSAADWAEVIDSTWGTGLPTQQKLQIFNTFWDAIDSDFACFHNIDVNWDSLRNRYLEEVSNGVSRGRFAAIMNYLALALRESHTRIRDAEVNQFTSLDPGVPLLYVGQFGPSEHFGAGLTPLPDSSLLVYQSVASHPLNLVPGDIVLGYDGIPWKQLYPELIAAQLPITGRRWGSSGSSYTHSWLMSAGMNWHLFDTLDVVKYATGDTLHLPTVPLVNQSESILVTEQLDIPGVGKPDILNGDVVSWGIVADTQIGYIYVWGWEGNAEAEFFDAIYNLMFNQPTDGLIIDFRYNRGGNMFLSNPGLSLLFNTQDSTIGFDQRCDPHDHFAMCTSTPPSAYIIPGDPATFYEKPIAVLTGPGALSAGDQVALRMKFHPMAKFFGKSTTASFNSPINLDLGNSSWNSRYARADAYLVSDPGHYLTHQEFAVDEEIWLTPDDVAQGFDTVVEAAIAWINDTTAMETAVSPRPPVEYNLLQNYPNPFNPATTIEFTLPKAGWVTLRIYNLLGEEVAQPVSERLSAGRHRYRWNAGVLPSGMYFYKMDVAGHSFVKKALLMK
ncbi:MAG: T9SS type A sorting domain-containing protein [Leptospiraceae bacterium]|nr:T9SS type A sorting domain-containing protein [Leptospiraceae bacterium]